MSVTPEQALKAIEQAYLTWVAGKAPDALTSFEKAVEHSLRHVRAS